MTEQALVKNILDMASGKKRFFVAIAGPPASGKTTLCDTLEKSLAKETSVSVVAMDGFHYDNAILENLDLLDRKGSPDTFDVTGLQNLLAGLTNQTEIIAAPVFDRVHDLSRGSARLIKPEDHIILVEGNYLLCRTEPWIRLQAYFDHTIGFNVAHKTLEARLVQRWLDHDHTIEQATERTHHNDMPNAEYVISHSIAAETIIEN